jgi:beta-phosphoglucomutase
MSLKGVVFDFNGTLVWDTPYHNKAFDIFLEKHHISLTDEEKSVKIHGKTNPDIMRGLFDRELNQQEIELFSREKELIYQDLIINDLRFAEGVEELFEELKNKHVPFTIATSSDIINIRFYFKELKLDKWFSIEKIVYNDGTLKGKPDPEIFLRAANRLGLDSTEIMVFEDSKAGIIAAERARAGEIIIVDSNNDDYSGFPHPIIRHFSEFDPAVYGL